MGLARDLANKWNLIILWSPNLYPFSPSHKGGDSVTVIVDHTTSQRIDSGINSVSVAGINSRGTGGTGGASKSIIGGDIDLREIF